jgi:hypothetical protein
MACIFKLCSLSEESFQLHQQKIEGVKVILTICLGLNLVEISHPWRQSCIEGGLPAKGLSRHTRYHFANLLL